MDSVDRFAAEAARFRAWARDGTDQAETAARAALVRLTCLYLAALDLPPPWSDELADQPDAERVENAEVKLIAEACRRLPVGWYGVVFDPHVVPPEEPVIGCLTDDLCDIYRDVVTGLREYEAGRRAQAVWEWSFFFQNHWGDHATSAIRALHCWLATNAPDRLVTEAALRTPRGS